MDYLRKSDAHRDHRNYGSRSDDNSIGGRVVDPRNGWSLLLEQQWKNAHQVHCSVKKRSSKPRIETASKTPAPTDPPHSIQAPCIR